jgi:hypothetical protein
MSQARLARAAARLLPAGRRDWAEAIWAEAREVPSGPRRLAWLAGGVRVMAWEVLMVRRTVGLLLFAVAAAAAVWATWSGSPAGFATAVARIDVVTAVAVLAGLPLLARRLLGSVGDGGLGRVLRVGGYAAVLVLIVAKAGVSRVAPAPAAGTPARAFDWFAQVVFLVVMAGYVAAILAVTARRARIAPATLAIGTGAGIALGVVMYAVAPLGLSKDATEAWLAGSAIDPVVALAWILLLAGPAVAGAVAGLRYRGQLSPEQLLQAPEQLLRTTVRQCGAAGLLTTGVGALIVTVLGTGTVALLPRAAWLRHWLYPGQHLVPAVARGHELAAASTVGGYGLILLAFPLVGLLLGLFACSVWPVGQAALAPAGGPLTAPEEAGGTAQ